MKLIVLLCILLPFIHAIPVSGKIGNFLDSLKGKTSEGIQSPRPHSNSGSSHALNNAEQVQNALREVSSAQRKLKNDLLASQRALLEKENSHLTQRFQRASASEQAELGVALKKSDKTILAFDAKQLKAKKEKLLNDIEILQRKKQEGALTLVQLKNADILIGKKNSEIASIGTELKGISDQVKTLDHEIVSLLENEVTRLQNLNSKSPSQVKKAIGELIEELQSQKETLKKRIEKIDSFKNDGNEQTQEMIENANRLKKQHQGELKPILQKLIQAQNTLQTLTP